MIRHSAFVYPRTPSRYEYKAGCCSHCKYDLPPVRNQRRLDDMHFLASGLAFLYLFTFSCFAYSTQGVEDLVRRRLPSHSHDFSFHLVNGSASVSNSTAKQNDHYVVSNGANGTIHVEGNTPIALASGLVFSPCSCDVSSRLNDLLD